MALNLIAVRAVAKDEDYRRVSVERLIDELAAIDSPAPGLSGMATYDSFILGDKPLSVASGVLIPHDGRFSAPPAAIPPAMLELVRRGPAALSALLAHLSDARPTKLTIGHGAPFPASILRWQRFNTEYDPRNRIPMTLARFRAQQGQTTAPTGYTVRVGDVCFTLIGQIVGRRLSAARYQPTGGLVINSPIERPELASAVARDWTADEPDRLRKSLVSDLTTASHPREYDDTLARVRIYFPDVYARLTGPNLMKRDDFEAHERQHPADEAGIGQAAAARAGS